MTGKVDGRHANNIKLESCSSVAILNKYQTRKKQVLNNFMSLRNQVREKNIITRRWGQISRRKIILRDNESVVSRKNHLCDNKIVRTNVLRPWILYFLWSYSIKIQMTLTNLLLQCRSRCYGMMSTDTRVQWYRDTYLHPAYSRDPHAVSWHYFAYVLNSIVTSVLHEIPNFDKV